MLWSVPYRDCSFNPKGGKPLWSVVSEATIGSENNIETEIIITCIVAGTIMLGFKENKTKQLLRFATLFVPVGLIYVLITFQGWHIGILSLLIVTYFIITDIINKQIIIKVFIVLMFITQIIWNVQACIYDINSNYSASKDVAVFLKNHHYTDKVIYVIHYSVTAIQPYFDKNIFINQNNEKAFYRWIKDTGYYKKQELMEKEADIYVFSSFYILNNIDLIKKLENNGYEKIEFVGDTYIKNHRYESEGYLIYIKQQ